MSTPKTITIREYLTQKKIEFNESGGQLTACCLFSGCDKDSTGKEEHLSFSADTGQYKCFKCGTTGNIFTLAKHLGDDPQDVIIKEPKRQQGGAQKKIDEKMVEACRKALPDRIRKYLNSRGITDKVIDESKLGYGAFYKKAWITIPIADHEGNLRFFKLRQDPGDGDEKMVFPGGEAEIYSWDTAKDAKGRLVICEGELDRLALRSKGVPAVTSTAGAGTFKEKWIEHFPKDVDIYVCFDNDSAGRIGAEDVAAKFSGAGYKTYKITLPPEVGEKGDITDYLTKLNGAVEDLFGKYAGRYPEEIDISQFKPLFTDDLAGILGLTIKQDDINKVTTFLSQLSAYTEENQFNTSFNAPSSTGKSYIPTETARYFPEADVMEIGYCSPTAFFHSAGDYDESTNTYTVDLSHKIIVFLDQPHDQLLERLRPVLSHDKKEIVVKITDKTQKHGMKTKTVVLVGYPSVIFCTAKLKMDEQEATRFILLSPEISQEKIRHAVRQTINREADSEHFKAGINADHGRQLLMKRILAIKAAGIQDIKLEFPDLVEEKFLARYEKLKPRQQRDIKNLIALVKAFALLNLWWRDQDGGTITANHEDVAASFKIWDHIYLSQGFGLPPYVFSVYWDIILACWLEKKVDLQPGEKSQGLTRKDVQGYHYKIRGSMLDTTRLRTEIIPMLETAGLICQETDPDDRRNKLIFPLVHDLKTPEDLE